ncbi:MAG: hypothetical protein KA457_03050 [Chitinophagales bacterium]|nr:hypothetical protein [Chitinophagales bacterium]
MSRFYAILLFTLIWLSFIANAQNSLNENKKFSNFKNKIIDASSDTLLLDTLPIFPNTLLIRDFRTDERISTEQYHFDISTGKLIFKMGLKPDSILVSYRTFPVNFTQITQHKYPTIIKKGDSLFFDRFYFQPKQEQTASFLDFGGLNYSGNFARGIQFGSNQDLSLNSTLDLRLNGKIGNGIEITASLTDNNIPLQPDGTTQQLQDFDKVFIQLKKDPHTIVAGDYNLKGDDSYFMKFSKQLQGASYIADLKFKNGIKLKTSTSMAVSRGKFTRNIFQGIEGNQGPYRLVGNNNETFIVILAGSEKVYVDGVTLQRGELLDYVIDYNTGELIFMPRFLITKDSRIVVEFEYSDRNYFRTTAHQSIVFQWKKLNIYTQVYSEQDAKNRPIVNSISDSIKSYLSTIGNDISSAYTSGIKPANYDPNTVQYYLKDSTVNSITYDSVFVYDTNPDSIKYTLSFSYVGVGKGNYVPIKNANNVRVYQWIAPVNGIPQGTFEPIILIVTPKNQLLFTFGTSYDIDSKTKIKAEIGFSNNDKNLFSSLGKKENKGVAATIQLNRKDSLKRNLILYNVLNYEFKQATFHAIEPYRNTEFTRDWNIANVVTNITEHIARYQTVLTDVKHNITTSYKFSTFIRQKKYQGFENWISFNMHYKNIKVDASARILNTQDSLVKSLFFRPSMYVSYSISKLKGLGFGAGFYQENNSFKNRNTQQLLMNSFKNNNFSFQFFLPDSAKWNFMLEYKLRKDVAVKNAQFSDSTMAHTLEFKGSANQLKNQTFNWTFTYRNLSVADTSTTQKPEQTFLARTEYGARIKRGVLRTNFIYEIGGGRERVRQFTYVEVASGLGYYRWIDQNGNGIKELNEFVPSQFNDSAQYIRVLTDLNEYVNSNSTSYTQNITIQPKIIWFNATSGIKKFMSKITLQSFMQVSRKTYKNNIRKSFNPFLFNTSDSNMLTLNSNIRNSFIFNSGDPVYSFSYTNQLLNEKILLVNGFDTRKRMENSLEVYYNISQKFNFNLKFIQSKINLNSQFFSNNDYKIRSYYLEPKFTYNYKTMLRTSINYGFTRKKNAAIYGGEHTLANKLEFELRYSKATKNTLETKFSFVQMKYNGENGTTKSYTILDGLQPGNNFIWSAIYTRNISQNLELSLSYDGRKTGTAKLINTGRAQLRAIF